MAGDRPKHLVCSQWGPRPSGLPVSNQNALQSLDALLLADCAVNRCNSSAGAAAAGAAEVMPHAMQTECCQA